MYSFSFKLSSGVVYPLSFSYINEGVYPFSFNGATKHSVIKYVSKSVFINDKEAVINRVKNIDEDFISFNLLKQIIMVTLQSKAVEVKRMCFLEMLSSIYTSHVLSVCDIPTTRDIHKYYALSVYKCKSREIAKCSSTEVDTHDSKEIHSCSCMGADVVSEMMIRNLLTCNIINEVSDYGSGNAGFINDTFKSKNNAGSEDSEVDALGYGDKIGIDASSSDVNVFSNNTGMDLYDRDIAITDLTLVDMPSIKDIFASIKKHSSILELDNKDIQVVKYCSHMEKTDKYEACRMFKGKSNGSENEAVDVDDPNSKNGADTSSNEVNTFAGVDEVEAAGVELSTKVYQGMDRDVTDIRSGRYGGTESTPDEPYVYLTKNLHVVVEGSVEHFTPIEPLVEGSIERLTQVEVLVEDSIEKSVPVEPVVEGDIERLTLTESATEGHIYSTKFQEVTAEGKIVASSSVEQCTDVIKEFYISTENPAILNKNRLVQVNEGNMWKYKVDDEDRDIWDRIWLTSCDEQYSKESKLLYAELKTIVNNLRTKIISLPNEIYDVGSYLVDYLNLYRQNIKRDVVYNLAVDLFDILTPKIQSIKNSQANYKGIIADAVEESSQEYYHNKLEPHIKSRLLAEEVIIRLSVMLHFMLFYEQLIFNNRFFYAASRAVTAIEDITRRLVKWLNECENEQPIEDYDNMLRWFIWWADGEASANVNNMELNGMDALESIKVKIINYFESRWGKRVVEYGQDGMYVYSKDMSYVDRIRGAKHLLSGQGNKDKMKTVYNVSDKDLPVNVFHDSEE